MNYKVLMAFIWWEIKNAKEFKFKTTGIKKFVIYMYFIFIINSNFLTQKILYKRLFYYSKNYYLITFYIYFIKYK